MMPSCRIKLRRTVARNLRRLRQETGLSQEELTDRAGLNRTTNRQDRPIFLRKPLFLSEPLDSTRLVRFSKSNCFELLRASAERGWRTSLGYRSASPVAFVTAQLPTVGILPIFGTKRTQRPSADQDGSDIDVP
jgi:hypothetical protein